MGLLSPISSHTPSDLVETLSSFAPGVTMRRLIEGRAPCCAWPPPPLPNSGPPTGKCWPTCSFGCADRARPRRVITVGYGIQCAAAAVMGATHLPVAAVLFLIAAVAFTTPAVSGASNRLIAERLTGDA